MVDLKILSIRDLYFVYQVLTMNNNFYFLGLAKRPNFFSHSFYWLVNFHRNEIRRRNYVVGYKNTKVGLIGCKRVSNVESHIYLAIISRYQNLGLATESIKLMQDKLKISGYKKVSTKIHFQNQASLKLFKKLGYTNKNIETSKVWLFFELNI
jgi:RimJ/RimL family protein N-acetyltransferase